MTLGAERWITAKKTLFVYTVFLVAVLFYPPREPGDTFFRIWIPHVAMVFGLVGHGVWHAISSLWLSSGRHGVATRSTHSRLQDWRPVMGVALLLGWGLQMAYAGAEQILVTAEHYRMRQPLHICDSQPELLLSAARPGDRVLYLSMLIMPHYLIHGCMKVGAVYHHDVMKNTDRIKHWLSRPDLRFAVAYNPLVYHPSFEGLHERRWGISRPGFGSPSGTSPVGTARVLRGRHNPDGRIQVDRDRTHGRRLSSSSQSGSGQSRHGMPTPVDSLLGSQANPIPDLDITAKIIPAAACRGSHQEGVRRGTRQ